ncbi:MAG: hypothetical protein ACT4TC_01320 [Myxococcaceae bacterium]
MASRFACPLLVCLVMLAALFAAVGATRVKSHATFLPASDAEIVERVASRKLDRDEQLRQSLREALAKDPQDLDTALKLARLELRQARKTADPRHLSYAEAALGHYWLAPTPPPDVQLLRATIRQSSHQFDEALEDLNAVVRARPDDAQARLTRATVLSVTGRDALAVKDCEALQPLAPAWVSTTCTAEVESMQGRSRVAYARYVSLAAREPPTPELQAWIHSTFAEIAARAGDATEATHHFTEALRREPDDSYTRGAYADFLLDQHREKEALGWVADKPHDDGLLLRKVLAEKRLGMAAAEQDTELLESRYQASHRRGDTVHRREEARFALHVLNDPRRALALARDNWKIQKEPWDARLLLEAAAAVGRPADAADVATRIRGAQSTDAWALNALGDH